ncbi:flagellin N-terminal helical domain-containing protein [Bacillus xiapuensis]|uniref:flagellin N-terminal helical domain-containing protein n=1 Tax=Bacillus xiapuensis TaxID=2014075 RepID=UPI000C24E5E1|nr:flagellin [Bacillus xiapuensis]
MRIHHNLTAMFSYRMYNKAISAQGLAMERLASGLRINRAADDPAGLAISERMRAQIRGLNQAARNTQDAMSFIQTAEGGLNETHAILQRMRELSVQAANDTLSAADRLSIQEEINELTEEVTRIGSDTEFNTIKVLDGTHDTMKIQVGANARQTTAIGLSDMRSAALGLTGSGAGYTDQGTLDMSSNESASSAISIIDQAVEKVSSQRSKLGSHTRRLEHTLNNLENTAENLTAAEMRIRGADMAKEMMNYTKNSILAQAAMAMMAQANQHPAMILQLLKTS